MTDAVLPDQTPALGEPQLDPVSEVLRHLYWNVRELARQELRPRSRRDYPAGDAWFHVVLEGAVDVTVDSETTRVEQGAFAFLMMDAAHAVVADAADGTVILSGRMTVDGGAALGGISGRMLVACRLLGEDPLVVAMLEAMEAEFAAGRVGGASIVDRLANVVGATAIRSWAESGCPVAGEWLTPLRDAHLGRAIAAIHRDPGSAWTVASLARVAQASRSSFAVRFASAVGEPPARYVERVRMQRAMVLLRRDHLSVAQTAERLGYSSDAAFSRAFRRFAGRSPRDWRQAA